MRYLTSITLLFLSLPVLAQEPVIVPELMERNCGKCHDENGKRTNVGAYLGSPEDVFQAVDGKPIDEIVELITHGKNKMPGFAKKLTEREILLIATSIDYINIERRIKKKYERVDQELERIKRDYPDLPPCEEVQK